MARAAFFKQNPFVVRNLVSPLFPKPRMAAAAASTSSLVWSAATSDPQFDISGNGLTATKSRNNLHANCFIYGSLFQTSGTVGFTFGGVGSDGGGNYGAGLSDGGDPPADYLGQTGNGIAYFGDGTIFYNGSLVTSGATYTSSDKITAIYDGTNVQFQKNGVNQGSAVNISGTLSSVTPAGWISTGNTGETYLLDPSGWGASSGTTWQLIGSGSIFFTETTSEVDATRGLISAVVDQWSESSALARNRAFTSSVAQSWSEAVSLVRGRLLPASTAAQVWSESAAVSRLQRFISAASQVWAESGSLVRIRGVVASSAASWLQTSVARRVRQFTSSCSALFSEAAALARLRSAVSAAAEVWSEASTLRRIRQFSATAAEVWAEGASLLRQRAIGSSAAAQSWTETSTLARLRGLNALAPAQWTEVSALYRKRSAVSTVTAVWGELATFGSGSAAHLVALSAFAFGESSSVRRTAGLVGTGAATTQETATLSRRAGLSSAGNVVLSAHGILSRAAALRGAGTIKGGETSAIGILQQLRASAAMLFAEQSSMGLFVPHGISIKFVRERLPFPRAAREDRTRKF